MPADVNKTVQITYAANVGPLERGIKNIPNVTRREMRAAIKSVDTQLKKAERAAIRTAKKMKANFKDAAKGIGMVGAGLATAGAGVLAFGQQMADLTNDLVDTSTKTGLAVDTLSALRLAAEGSGLAFEQFIGPLQRLQLHMVDANNGVKLSSKLFEDMGVKVNDSNGALRSADDVFREMMTKLGAMSNPLERNVLLMDTFGKSGAAFVQSGVVGALDDFVNLSRTFGSETAPDAIQQAANFQRAMADLSLVGRGTMQGILTTITGTGGLNDAVDFLTEGVIFFEASFKKAFAAISIPVTVLQTELYSLAVLLTDGIDAAKASWAAGSELVQQDLDTFNSAFDDAEAKITALRTARQKIRGTGATEAEKPQETQNSGSQIAKDESKAIQKLTEDRRTDLDAIKQIIKAQEQLRGHIAQFAIDNETQEQQIKRAHYARVQQYNDEIDAVNRRYGAEYKALYEMYENKEITEEEGMARLKAIEKETYDAIDLMRHAEVSSARRMYEELNELSEENAQQEIDRRQEVAAAVKESFLSSAMSVANSLTTIQENELAMMSKQMQSSIDAINEQEAAGLINSKVAAKERAKIEEDHMAKSQEQQMKIYNMKKATAIAQILIDAATAAARAFADFPFPASLGIAALAGGGALAQIKAVESTPPPTFDMGGMIGNNDARRPDERYVRALEGEAILDRATVQSLGGETGVRRLQNGNSSGVVVIQPFKHFDRFMRSRNRKRAGRTGRGGY